MFVNEEACARVVFWSLLIILYRLKKWGCCGCMRGSRDHGVWGLQRLVRRDGC